MPVVRISEEAMERLKKWAEPLGDTTESAFVKVLNAAEKSLDTERGVTTSKKPEAVRPQGRRKPRDDSPRGLWELSEKGIRQAEAWLAKEPKSFIDHLLAMPDAGEDRDFDRPRSGPRRIEL